MDEANTIKELEKQVRDLEGLLKETKKKADEAIKTKTMFLANMSHEIRTPMNSIIGIYNILNQTNLTEEQKEFLEIIHISSQNLLAIINDILDLSKIESGQLKIEQKPFLLHEEIHQVIKLLSLKAKGKGIELFSKIQSTVPTCIIGDPVRLKQILINLTNNAIKFTNEGNVFVAVETIEINAENLLNKKELIPDEFTQPGTVLSDTILLKFEVTDTGIGISPEEQENLFNEYAQLENSLVRQFEGTGLGLSISRNLTELMHGKIGVISKKGKGSTFWFTLAVTKGDEEMIISHRFAYKPKVHQARSLSILLVEDNILNQKFAVTSLQRAGNKVEIAENGKVAVEKFKKSKFDLILMDIAMPIMDGIEATRVIREWEEKIRSEKNENYEKIKIVAITAHVMVTDRDKCLKAGMDEYLAKPYRPQELISMIENLDV